jgi:hypothetical protein
VYLKVPQQNIDKRALFEGKSNLISHVQASDWEPGNGEKLTLNQGLRFGGEGGI